MRQKPIGKYIVDFYCSKLKLIIEIDGESHDYEDAYVLDQVRHKKLEASGLHFLRFDDEDVKQYMDNVLYVIEHWIIEKEK